MHDGAFLKWPERCRACRTRECVSTARNALDVCPYGYNYIGIAKDLIVAGILIRDFDSTSIARASRLKREHQSRIDRDNVELALNALRVEIKQKDSLVDHEKEKAIQNYIKSEQYKTDFIKRIQPEIQKGLAFVHDYKQINAQISQNINVIIESKYSGQTFESKLAQSNQYEKAIYEASKYLEEKLSAVKFLLHPEWLDRSDECVSFRFHGLVHKYLKIYAPRFVKKGVRVETAGESFKYVYANPQAVAVIPHTLIDNAAKYSPKSGTVEVTTHDNIDSIIFSVASLGPKINDEETDKIFHAFYRSINAQRVEEEGAGYGLYVCQLVAKRHLGTTVTVMQEPKEIKGQGYRTTFSIVIPLRAAVAPWQRGP